MSLEARSLPASLAQRRRRRSVNPAHLPIVPDSIPKQVYQPGQTGRLQVSLVKGTTHLPRTIRSRVAQHERSCARRSARTTESPKSPQSPSSPHQETTFSTATGRVALGPWTGPYAPHPSSVEAQELPATLYLDPAGGCHFELDKSIFNVLDASAKEVAAAVASKQPRCVQPPQCLSWQRKTYSRGKSPRSAARNYRINQPRA